jgi:hypothetical protein
MALPSGDVSCSALQLGVGLFSFCVGAAIHYLLGSLG